MDNENISKSNMKIKFLEKSHCQYICTVCLAFETDSSDLFNKHHLENHKYTRIVNCIYCCSNVKTVNLTQHIEKHFQKETYSKDRCGKCSDNIDVTSAKAVLSHVNETHTNQIQCPICLAEFAEIDDLYHHIKASITTLYHCLNQNCLVSSHDEEQFKAHMAKAEHDPLLIETERIMTCLNRKYMDNCCSSLLGTEFKKPKAIPSQHDNETVDNIAEVVLVEQKPIENVSEHKLEYSKRVLKKLFPEFNTNQFEILCNKMNQFATFSFLIGFIEGKKYFLCKECTYKSEHGSTDVRKHIMSVHCSMTSDVIRESIKSNKIDINYNLINDKKMIEYINNNRIVQQRKQGLTIEHLIDSENEEMTPPKKRRLRAKSSGTPIGVKKAKDDEIVLQYSDVVMEHLCKVQCLEHIVDDLRSKMMIYSTYTAQIISDDATKHLVCSGCPTLKLRGGYDFVKHVFSKHATISTVYRGIAKACSKMDRNYNLLSDEELLNLEMNAKADQTMDVIDNTD